jgi:hypothetical protein
MHISASPHYHGRHKVLNYALKSVCCNQLSLICENIIHLSALYRKDDYKCKFCTLLLLPAKFLQKYFLEYDNFPPENVHLNSDSFQQP